MANIFDSTNWPKFPPDPFIAGDYFAFKKTGLTGEFPIASYAVTFYAFLFGSSTGTTSASQIAITATESGSEYQITKNGSDTASWTVGITHGRYSSQTPVIQTNVNGRSAE